MNRQADAPSSMRSDNRLLIFKYVRKAPISRSDIANAAGICKSSVTTLANRLIKQGLLTEIGSVDKGVGRRPVLLDIVADYRYAIGVHIADSGFICISDLKCETVKSIPLFNVGTDKDGFAAYTENKITELLTNLGIPLCKCIGICISFSESSELALHTQKHLEEKFPLPVRVNSSTELFCARYGAADGKTSMLIMLGSSLRAIAVFNANTYIKLNIENFPADGTEAFTCRGENKSLGECLSEGAICKRYKTDSYKQALENAAAIEYVADRLSYAISEIMRFATFDRAVVCGNIGDSGKTLTSLLQRALSKNGGTEINLETVELSNAALEGCSCITVINEYFERQ